MLSCEHLTTTSGKIKADGTGGKVLMLDGPNVYPRWNPPAGARYKEAAEHHRQVKLAGPGNVRLYRAGTGAKATGLAPNQWVAIVDGKVYARLPGGGDRGQYWRSSGNWHTRVVPLRGNLRKAVLAATK